MVSDNNIDDRSRCEGIPTDSATNTNASLLATSPFQQASMRLGSPVARARAMSRGNTPPPMLGGELGDTKTTTSQKRGTHSARGSFANGNRPNLSAFGRTESGDSNSDDNSSAVAVDIDNPDPQVVRVVGRHLVGDRGRRRSGSISSGTSHDNNNNNHSNQGASTSGNASENGTSSRDDDSGEFDSLKLQGGDITRQLYNWQREHMGKSSKNRRHSRSKSFNISQSANAPGNNELESNLDVKNIKAPGGMRRSFIQQQRASFGSTTNRPNLEGGLENPPPPFFTRNFIEFLTLYGHFAGEELEDDEGEEEPDNVFDEGEYPPRRPGLATERSALIPKRRKSYQAQSNKASTTKAVLLLLKSFVGTGVLFLPKAYSNGGLLFCSVLLALISILSYWCFLLLIASKDKVGVSSFGDIGGALYGPHMREIILGSIVLSQIGFAAAYIVFVSENLQALISAVAGSIVPIEKLIAAQLLLFLPCSMIRDIAKLSFTALIADLFILMGLVYLYAWGANVLVSDGVGPDLKMFNPNSWTLFIGTAIFTFEGIGLIIPIQESMKRPQDFHGILAGVMVGITLIFISMGALQYAAYGSEVKTVILLNLPSDSVLVNLIQLLYALAIMLSTPLQLFPAIRIVENWMFKRSGKYNPKIKWQKNLFRFFLTICTAIVAWGGADDLDKFVALVGSFACIPLVYIYPPMLHIRAVKQGPLGMLGDILICAFGFGAMVYTTSTTIQSWLQH